MDTKEIIQIIENKQYTLPTKPEIFTLQNQADRTRFETLLVSDGVQRVVDTYKAQVEELFAIQNPPLKFSPDFTSAFETHYSELTKQDSEIRLGCWIYFPWNKTLIHLLEEKDFQVVRTARNKPLLTQEEQTSFYNTTVAIAGLSVGNAVALSIVHQGGARKIKIADHDTLDLSNLNRIRGDVASLGGSKVEMTARQIYELNPYAEIELYPDGINDGNIKEFVAGADVLVDEMDNLAWKYRLREMAQKRKLPVVSAADLDRCSILSVERFDQDQNTPYFNGALGDVTLESLTSLSKLDTGRMIAKLLGIENQTPRMFSSLQLLGKEIISWPQLGPTASMGGALLVYCVERIANNKPMSSGTHAISLDALLDPQYMSE